MTSLAQARSARDAEIRRRSAVMASRVLLPPTPSSAEADAFASCSWSTPATEAVAPWPMTESATLTRAQERRAAEIERRSAPPPPIARLAGELYRPTPNSTEADLQAAGTLTMLKLWDLSPIQADNSHDPTQPPSELPPPPVNTSPPTIVLFDTLEVGHTVAGQAGSWSGSPSYTRAWLRDGVPIPGEAAPGYTFVAADVGAMIGLRVTATNAGGSASADALPVGPVVPVVEAAPRARAKATAGPKAPR